MNSRVHFYRFRQGKRLRDNMRKPAYVLRLFHPRGQYPRCKVVQHDAIFWADEELVFSVTRSTPWRYFDSDAPYTEMDWLNPEELRFLGSILFTERRDWGSIRFYPVYKHGPILSPNKLDFTKPAVQDKLRRTVWIHAAHPSWPEADNLSDCLRLRYSLLDTDHFTIDRQPLYWNGINQRDYVLLRGISALIKSDMLSCYHEFIEEAVISVFIAMDASFQLILRQLRKDGKKNPGAKDAALWLFEHFDKPMGLPQPTVEKYFGELYDQRLMTMHPSSRLGDHPYAPVMVDDLFLLRDSLREILGYLATGTHGPDFHDAVAKRRGP